MRVVKSRVTIEASLESVWATLTRPEFVKKWQYDSVVETDWSVGSPIRFTSEWEGQTFTQWGTVLSFDSSRALRYSLFAPRPGLDDRPENYFTMSYSLDGGDGETVVTITQEDPRETDSHEVGEGDESVLVALKNLAESIGSSGFVS